MPASPRVLDVHVTRDGRVAVMVKFAGLNVRSVFRPRFGDAQPPLPRISEGLPFPWDS